MGKQGRCSSETRERDLVLIPARHRGAGVLRDEMKRVHRESRYCYGPRKVWLRV